MLFVHANEFSLICTLLCLLWVRTAHPPSPFKSLCSTTKANGFCLCSVCLVSPGAREKIFPVSHAEKMKMCGSGESENRKLRSSTKAKLSHSSGTSAHPSWAEMWAHRDSAKVWGEIHRAVHRSPWKVHGTTLVTWKMAFGKGFPWRLPLKSLLRG